MNSIQDQTTSIDFLSACNNAYKTIEDEFQKLLNDNKTSTLESVTSKLTKEFGLATVFPKEKIDLVREEIPVINGIKTYEELSKLDGRVVRYFCFVQDILESEIQIGALVKKSGKGDQTVEEYLVKDNLLYINYRDSYNSEMFENFDPNEDALLFDRNNVLTTPIPYQNEWLAKALRGNSRSEPSQTLQDSAIQTLLGDYFRTKGAPQGFSEKDFAFGPACLIKFYESLEGKVALNQIIEVVGILQYQLDQLKEYKTGENSAEGAGFANVETLYPSALFPRVHAISSKSLSTVEFLSQKSITKSLEGDLQLNFGLIRDELVGLLSTITLDKQISELLLINLVSKIYMRKDIDSLGSLTLNLMNAEQAVKVLTEDGQESSYTIVELLHLFIRKLLPFTFKIDIEIKGLGGLALQPKKDYELNCLSRGALQMPSESLILVDETKLDAGTLGEKAVKNLQTLQNMIKSQGLIYDFVYYETTLNADVKTLILSKSKTILASDVQRKLSVGERTIKESDEIFRILFKGDSKWETYRKYMLECSRNVETVQISKEVSKLIESDYIAESNKVKPELLNQRLNVSRYLAAIEGKEGFDLEIYNAAKTYDP